MFGIKNHTLEGTLDGDKIKMEYAIQTEIRTSAVLFLAACWSLGCAKIDSSLEKNAQENRPKIETDNNHSDTGATDTGESAFNTSDDHEKSTTTETESSSDTKFDSDTKSSSDTGSIDSAAKTNDSDDTNTNDNLVETDSGSDSDSITAPDDDCPADPNKESPGQCGCGIPDIDVGDTASCIGLMDALIHRYRFNGTGMTIVDSIGTTNGTANVELPGDGSLTLSGGSNGDYITFPSGILSSLSSVTIECWATWYGGEDHQRLLSFGTAEPNEPDSMKCTGSAAYYDGSWYEFCNRQKVVWSTARSVCEDAGGYLVEIESAEEENYIDTHPDFTDTPWIGANDLVSEGEWYFAKSDGLQAGVHFWSGDENGSAPAGVYENWRRDDSEPKDANPNADCAYIYKLSPPVWMTYNCQSLGAFICEWRGHQGSSMNRGLWFTPADEGGLPSLTVKAGVTAAIAQAATAFPSAEETHVALVLDPANNNISLYIDGTLAASVASYAPLANLRDTDNWIGRSQVIGNSMFDGALSEFRIYDQALTPEQVATSYLAGPDPEFLEP